MNHAQRVLRHHVTGAVERGDAQPIVETPPPGPRRVRLERYVNEPLGRIPAPQRIGLIEYPRVSSRRQGRPDIWEWRLLRGMLA